jgi:hypothetical protein
MKKRNIAGTLTVLMLTGCQTMNNQQAERSKAASAVAGTPAGTVMTKDYVETVGRMAYIWGWPLVNNYNPAETVKSLPEPGRLGGVPPVSPQGYVSMLTDYDGDRYRLG